MVLQKSQFVGRNIKDIVNEVNIRSPYLKYAHNIYSQAGDNGIIKKLFEELKIFTGSVVEFGAWDGIFASNTFDLWRYRNFNAVLAESNSEKFKEMLKLAKTFDNVECYDIAISCEHNNPNSLDNVLSRSKFDFSPNNFVLLSIDVDSTDFNIFNSVKKFEPIIIVIETAGGWSPEQEYIGDGASLKAMHNLAVKKGYTLVCTVGNAYFIRNDRVKDLNEYDETLSLADYHLSDDMINLLQGLDENGNFSDEYRYLSDKYMNFIESEKNKIMNS